MVCTDRQLTEAQRIEGFNQQRTGVQAAVRPFSGPQTLDNLIDYINRELQPAVKRTRSAVNDVYRQATDNAPSGNPLQYYFSVATAAVDPTVGRLRLDTATQNVSTVIRLSETNARLASVAVWLDVMAGSATVPLGTVMLIDAVNPTRFLRYDLNTMVDQGAYWDLGVTIIESSHPNPFVEDGPVVISFTPGVAAAGATVPSSTLADGDKGDITVSGAGTVWTVDNDVITNAKLADMAAATIKGRALGAGTGDPQDLTAAQVAAIIGSVAWTEVEETGAGPFNDYNAGTPPLHLIASNAAGVFTGVSGALTAGAMLLVTHLGAGYTELQHNVVSANGFRFFNGGTGKNLRLYGEQSAFYIAGDADPGAGTAMRWLLVSPSFPFADASDSATGDVVARTGTQYAVVSGGNSADVVLRGNATFGTVSNAALRNSGPLSVIGRSANTTGAPADISATAASGAVLRESGSVLGFGTVATAGITDDAVTNAKIRNSGALSVIGRSANTTGDPADISAVAASGAVLRESGSTIGFGSLTLAALPTIADDTFLANISGATAVPSAVALTTLAGAGLTGGADAILAVGAGTGITVNANDVAVTRPLTNDAVTNADLRDSGPLSVIGRSANSTGDPADISAIAASGAVLRESGSVLGFGTVATAGIADAAVTNAKFRDSAAFSILGRATGTAGAIADMVPVVPGDAGQAFGFNAAGTALGFNLLTAAGLASNAVTTVKITDANVTLAKMADLAQARIIGRALTAGTGVPTALTGAQVADILEPEAIAWTAAHSFSAGVTLNSTALLSGQVRFNSVFSSSTITLDDVAIGSANVVRLTGSSWVLSGMVAANSSQLTLICNGHISATGSILIEATASTAANRFAGTGTSRAVRAGDMVVAWYDGTSSRWRLSGSLITTTA